MLFALPALLLYGLLGKSREIFSMPEGFYPLESVFLLLALMALARIPSLESLRYVAPGEWGKLLGLDRIPEVRTLRLKLSQLCSERGRAERWSGILAKQWMESEVQSAGVFYADGHVRIYHDEPTVPPQHHVPRQLMLIAFASTCLIVDRQSRHSMRWWIMSLRVISTPVVVSDP